MEFGEQITGTRDEHYNLIAVLYHALQGAENCNTYALDAEAVGDREQIAFFREAGLVQVRLAERAKAMLGVVEVPPEPGISPEGPIPSTGAVADPMAEPVAEPMEPVGTAMGDVPPRSADLQADIGMGGAPPGGDLAGDLPPETGVTADPAAGEAPTETGLGGFATPTTGGTRTPPETPPGTALPGGEVASPLSDTGSAATPQIGADPEVLQEEGLPVNEGPGAAQVPQEQMGGIDPGDLDPTISLLEGGVAQADLSRAAAEIEGWERRLEAAGDPELQAIAGNLGALRGLLSEEDTDIDAAGPLLVTLAEQVRGVAAGGAGVEIADRLQQLAGLLGEGGRSLSG